MLREKYKWVNPRGESTDAEHWGGPARTSDEGCVMRLEQRGWVKSLHLAYNWRQDETVQATEPAVMSIWLSCSLDGSGVNREIHAPFCERPGVKFLRPTHLIFREDDRRLAKDHGPQNFSRLTKIAVNLLRQNPDTSARKKSLRLRRKRIGWDDDARMALLGLQPL